MYFRLFFDRFVAIPQLPVFVTKEKVKNIYLHATLTTTFFERTDPMPHRVSFAKQRYTPDVRFEY